MDGCLLWQILVLPLNQTALKCQIQSSSRPRSRRIFQRGKDSDHLGIALGGVAYAKAATTKTTVASAWTAWTNPSSVVPIPSDSVVCKLTYISFLVVLLLQCFDKELENLLLSTRYKRCDQIEERKARRLSGRTAPKGNFPLQRARFNVAAILPLHWASQQQAASVFLFKGASKRRRSSFGHSSNDEGNEGGADSPFGLQGDGHSPSVRKQPKRVVKPRVYFDLVDYDSDLDDKAASSFASPGRRRGTGSRFNQGK